MVKRVAVKQSRRIDRRTLGSVALLLRGIGPEQTSHDDGAHDAKADEKVVHVMGRVLSLGGPHLACMFSLRYTAAQVMANKPMPAA